MGFVQKLKRKFWYTRMLEGCGRLVKIFLLITNLFILAGGILVFYVGAWTLCEKSFMAPLLGSNLYVSTAAIFVVSGGLVIFVSLFGCVGVFREIKCLLLTFFVSLFMVLISLLVGGILVYVFRNEVGERLYQELVTSVAPYGDDSAITKAWDDVQQRFECCGVPGPAADDIPYRIWLQNVYFNENLQVPESCCPHKDRVAECQENPSRETAYAESCHVRVLNFVREHADTMSRVAIGVSSLLLLGMVLSCTMALMIQC